MESVDADRLKRLWADEGRYLALAFLSGAATVLAFAPFSYSLVAVIAPLPLLLMWRNGTPAQAFRQGWAYGLGLLGFGVFWMHISIDQFGNLGTLAAIAITLLFVLGVSLFYGLVGWSASHLGRQLKRGVHQQSVLLFIPALWVLGEWLRGWVLTGFPWLALGYSQIESPLAGFAPLLGVYGVSGLVLLTSALLALSITTGPRGKVVAVMTVALIWFGGGWMSRLNWSSPAGPPLKVSMIQGNIPQEIKWKRQQLAPTLSLYTRLTREHWESDLIIWPETAVPSFAHLIDEGLLQPLQSEAIEHESELLIGIPVWKEETRQYFNTMLLLGEERGSYFKRHLVPFGEFMPLAKLLSPITRWLNIPMSSFSAGDDTPPILKVAGYPAGISICYEDAFGSETIEALPQAAFLINTSNDAWFGDSLAPPQHLEIARMRALETGRYLLRSTNTGISAIIDHKGQLLATSPAFKQHVLTGEFLPMKGNTPYTMVGNWLVIGFIFLLLIAALSPPSRKQQ
ncbi:MAG: apolipoprotein N-acyltransferase [Candidatus Sedimenticola sp. (ex Thyasira tokunagai)]